MYLNFNISFYRYNMASIFVYIEISHFFIQGVIIIMVQEGILRASINREYGMKLFTRHFVFNKIKLKNSIM